MKPFSSTIACILVSFAAAIPTTSFANSCELAEQYYNRAMVAGGKQDFTTASDWLRKSVDICGGFRNWHLLGRSEQRLGNFSSALQAYENAESLAEIDDERASAIARYAEVLSLNGQREEALTMIHAARELHSNTPNWMTNLAKELDLSLAQSPVTKDQIKRGFKTMPFKALNLSTKPSVNIRINFEYDSTELDSDSQKNLEQLAAALADEEYRDNSFLLVGHTDVRGEERYNEDLSLRRAEAIRQTILSIDSNLSGRLMIEGRGEVKPLYNGDTETDHRLNRRLQVIVQ